MTAGSATGSRSGSKTGGPVSVYFATAARRVSLWQHALLAALAFGPPVLTARGRVAADTRQQILVDPIGFLGRALDLWDPQVHLGTVTHSTIGNVFPMGTFFAIGDVFGLPVWLVQRLWLGALLFAAGAGVLFLARSIRWTGVGPMVAALVYLLTPYALQYGPRTSVLLLPFAALPWLIGLTERALRTGGWRHPALLALLVVTCSGSNPSALALVVLGPLLWVACSLAARRTDWRRVISVAWQTALLTVGTCALWLAALALEARYGLNLLTYTETLSQVSTTSTSPEALRGLGYWLFYGNEARAPNIEGARHYLEQTPVVLVSYLLPGLALVAAFLVRWRYRAFAIASVVVGVVVAVGAYPYDDPSPLGDAYASLADSSSITLALRSSTRAVPVVVLGLALLLGAGVDTLWRRKTAQGTVAAVLVTVLVLVDAAALLSGGFVDPSFSRPSAIPTYWRDAAAALDRDGDRTRVLELPGSSFAAYRWGSTYETPILPTLLDRPSAAREQLPFGTAASVDLLAALDRRVQEGVLDEDALAPVARLLGVGDVVLRSDLEFERYETARPRATWRRFTPPPAGLGAPEAFGVPIENRAGPRIPLVDAETLGLPANSDDPAPVTVFPVDDAQPIVRTVGSDHPTVLVGDGEGFVDAAAVGLITGENLVVYAASLVGDAEQRERVLDRRDADIVVTDTNRRRDRRWRSTRDAAGLTDRAGHDQPDTGQGEADLEVFDDIDDGDRTVSAPRGATVEATRYGSSVTFDTDQRAALAIDGDPDTAWQVGTIEDPVGEVLTIRSDRPITTDHVDLLQATDDGAATRLLSEVELRFDGSDPVRVQLDDRSLSGGGQRIAFPERAFRTLDVEIVATRETADVVTRGGSPSGIAELTVPGLVFEDLVRVPDALTRSLGAESDAHRLVYVFTRLRSDPARRGDEETALLRVFHVPTPRAFSLTGTARLADDAPDEVIDALLGAPGPAQGGLRATSSGRLPGAVDQRARAAFDGDRSTHWTGTFEQQAGSWLEAELPNPTTFDRLDLAVVADGRHSVPTQVRIDAGDESRVVDVPAVADTQEPDATTVVPITFAPLTGSVVRTTVTRARDVLSTNAFSGLPQPQPVAIAEVGVPGIAAPPLPAELQGECVDDLLSLDGAPLPVRVTGSTTDAARRDGLRIETCADVAPLDRGDHVLRSARGAQSGILVDRVVLGSAAGGAPLGLTNEGNPLPPPPSAGSPRLEVLDSAPASSRVRVGPSDEPFWLVLGQSHNDGWNASVGGGASLGRPTLVDGYANGWYVEPASRAREITMTWTPQRTIWIALVITLLAVVACVLLVWRGRRFHVRSDEDTDVAVGEHDGRPMLESPRAAAGRRPRDARVLVGVPLGAAVVTAIVVTPLAGLVAGAVVTVAVVWRSGRVLLAVASLALVAAGLIGVVATQAREDRPVGYDWTRGEESEHRLALTGLLLLACDPIVVAIRRRAGAEPDDDPVDGPDHR